MSPVDADDRQPSASDGDTEPIVYEGVDEEGKFIIHYSEDRPDRWIKARSTVEVKKML